MGVFRVRWVRARAGPCARAWGTADQRINLAPAGVVGTVHLGVAVHAAAAHQEAGRTGAAACRRQARWRARHRGVAGRAVALLAQQRRRLDEQGLAHRAVRAVAQRAVFGHRRVLPQHRAALVGVAAVAGLVHRGFAEHGGAGGAVCAVAVAAGHLALPTGWAEVLRKSVRCCLWQAKHTCDSWPSSAPGRVRGAPCGNRCRPGPPVRARRHARPVRALPSWQLRQILLRSSSETLESGLKVLIDAAFLLRACSGAGAVAGLALQAAHARKARAGRRAGRVWS
jgi:hypothetical protein